MCKWINMYVSSLNKTLNECMGLLNQTSVAALWFQLAPLKYILACILSIARNPRSIDKIIKAGAFTPYNEAHLGGQESITQFQVQWWHLIRTSFSLARANMGLRFLLHMSCVLSGERILVVSLSSFRFCHNTFFCCSHFPLNWSRRPLFTQQWKAEKQTNRMRCNKKQ